MPEAKKYVIRAEELNDDRDKKRALHALSCFLGIDSVSFDTKDKKLMVVGSADAVEVVRRLRKKLGWRVVLASLGPAK